MKTAISNGIKVTGLMLMLLLFAPAQVQAASGIDNYWICGSDQWDTASCWSEGMPPEYGDNVFVTDWSIGGATIDYISAADPMLNYLEIGNGSSGANTLTQSQDTLTTDYMTIGYLYYDLGYYELSDPGNLNVNYLLTVGAEGVGYISQFDGTNTVGDNLVLGDQAGGTGYYDLSGGDLSANDLHIGEYGTGEFTQSGGTNTIVSELFLGRNTSSAYGTYDLSGGTLSVGWAERIGIYGIGTFTQSAGSNSATDLFLGDAASGSGTYDLSGGDLTTESLTVGNYGSGTFNQYGGVNIVNNTLTLGANDNGLGGSSGTYNLTGGDLSTGGMGATTIVGDAGTGIFNNSGGVHTETGNVILGNQATSNGTYNLSGTGSLDVTGNTIVGNQGYGYFNQTGGTNNTAGLYIGNDSGGSGTYDLSGGNLTTFWASVGESNVGVFNQSGGTHTADFLILGNAGGSGTNSDGTYNLSGTGVLTASDEWVGGFGKGVFNQTGGTNTVGNNLVVAEGPENYAGTPTRGGDYNLSAGDLSVTGRTIVGMGNDSFSSEPGGKGTFTQSGGTHSTDTLVLGSVGTEGSGTGTYNLSGGGLSAVDVFVGEDGESASGTGAFNQTGGTLDVSNVVIIGNNGVFDFQGGTANVGNALENFGTFKGSGAGTFNGYVINYGTVSPGASPGVLAINGNYTQDSSGILDVELAGLLWGTKYDVLTISGTATLDGTLTVSLLDSFLPGFGNSFSILEAADGVSGTFSNLNLPSLGGGLGWEVAYNPTNVNLTVTPEPVAMTLFLLGGAPIAANLYRRHRRVKA